MATKSLALLDCEVGLLNGNGSPFINGSRADKASPGYIARLLVSSESPDQEVPSPLDGLEMGAYRIGLVPVEVASERAGFLISVPTSLDSVLVLPFTWNELMTHVR